MEKAFLIHEMFSVEGHGRKADRKSRHLYDLSEMMKHGIDDKAIKMMIYGSQSGDIGKYTLL